MGKAGLTAFVVIAAGVILYSVAYLLGLPSELRSGLAGVPAVFVKDLYDIIERRISRQDRLLPLPNSPMTLSRLQIRAPYLVLLGTIMCVGSFGAFGWLMTMLIVLAGLVSVGQLIPISVFLTWMVIMTTIPVKIFFIVYLGRWIGIRSDRHAFIVITVIVILGLTAGSLGTLTLSSDIFTKMFGTQRTPQFIWYKYITGMEDLLFYIPAGWLGTWLGQRARLSEQMALLLRALPSRTQQTVVDLVQDEIFRTANH